MSHATFFIAPPRFLQWRCAIIASLSVAFLIPTQTNAQDAVAGKALYNTPFVAGQSSCSNGGCHTADPTRNQNRIRNGANADNILFALNSVSSMRFLSGSVSEQNRLDLAAYIANPAAGSGAPIAQISATALDFSTTLAGSSSAGKTLTLTNTGNAPLAVRTVNTDNAAFDVTAITCSPATQIAPGGNCLISVHFIPSATGAQTATLTIAHNASPATTAVTLIGIGGAATAVGETKVMTEYRHIALNFFFITSRDSDKALLDTVAAFERTGQSFLVFSRPLPGRASISRYYFDQIAKAGTRGTHFYTLVDLEKQALLIINPTNSPAPRMAFDEGIDSFAIPPVVEGIGGSCAVGLVPVLRLFRPNARFPDDPNHRFTTSLAIYNDFIAQGWDGEGVKLCVPSQ
jgi:hypothetical protein